MNRKCNVALLTSNNFTSRKSLLVFDTLSSDGTAFLNAVDDASLLTKIVTRSSAFYIQS